MSATEAQGGGFLPTSLPSPPLSTSTPLSAPTLPPPRSQTLRAGSQKEREFRNYVENRLLEISGRYERRYNVSSKDAVSTEEGSNVKGTGYESFAAVVKDLDQILNVIWVSATPSLQIPFCLNVALAFSSYILSFPFSPKSTFELARKLDLVFSSFLNETNVETGDSIPGFDTGRKVTMTEKVRLRGLVERTRTNIARVANAESSEDRSRVTEITTDDADEDEDEDVMDDENDNIDLSWEMEVARIYERTIVDLGPSLDGAAHVGIPG